VKKDRSYASAAATVPRQTTKVKIPVPHHSPSSGTEPGTGKLARRRSLNYLDQTTISKRERAQTAQETRMVAGTRMGAGRHERERYCPRTPLDRSISGLAIWFCASRGCGYPVGTAWVIVRIW